MTKMLTSALITLLCSASYAFHQQSTHEIRDNETWITVKMDMGTEAKADVLFVVDDSGSMSMHQQNLANQAALIADGLSYYQDVNAAVITTTLSSAYNPTIPSGGKFVGPVLNSQNSDFAANLSKQINVGTAGEATETFFDPLMLATTEPLLSTTNANFLRNDADLVLVFLTDTEDQSKTATGSSVYAHLQSLKPNNSIGVIRVGIIDSTKCEGEQELLSLTGLKDFVTLAGGQTVDLCSDFSKEIPKAIGELKKLVSEVVLSTFPNTHIDFHSIAVRIDGKLLAPGNLQTGWTFDTPTSKVILGSSVVSDSSLKVLEITYKVLPN